MSSLMSGNVSKYKLNKLWSISYNLIRYDMLALIITIMSLVTGTKFVLALHERKNYSTQAPDKDVRNIQNNELKYHPQSADINPPKTNFIIICI